MDPNARRPDDPESGHREGRHDVLRLGLLETGRRLRLAVDDPQGFAAARARLAGFCVDELFTHLAADEAWLLAAEQHSATRLLARATRAEVRAIAAAVDDISTAAPYEAVAATRAVHTLLAVHDLHEGLLRSSPRVDT